MNYELLLKMQDQRIISCKGCKRTYNLSLNVFTPKFCMYCGKELGKCKSKKATKKLTKEIFKYSVC